MTAERLRADRHSRSRSRGARARRGAARLAVAAVAALLWAMLAGAPAAAQTGGDGTGVAEPRGGGELRGVMPRLPGLPADAAGATEAGSVPPPAPAIGIGGGQTVPVTPAEPPAAAGSVGPTSRPHGGPRPEGGGGGTAAAGVPGTAGTGGGAAGSGGAGGAASAVGAAGAAAPGVGAAQAGAAPGGTAADPAAGGDAALRALAEVLRDDAARARLLAELDRLTGGAAADPAGAAAGAAAAGAEGGAATEAAPEGERETVGRRLAETTQQAAKDIAATLSDLFNGLAATLRRLQGLSRLDSDGMAEIGSRLAVLFAVTVSLYVAFRLIARPLFRMLGAAAAAGGFVRKAIAYVASVAVDVLTVVLAWAAGYAIAMVALEPRMQIGLLQTIYLNAFLAVELVKVVLRAILAPSEGRLRPLPMSGATANYWAWWGSVLASVLGYGLMLAVPVVAEFTSVFTGRAVSVVIFAVVVLTAMALVVAHRGDLARHLAARLEADPGDVTLKGLVALARIAWVGAIVWLGLLFVYAVTEAGNVGPFATGSAKVVGAVAAALLIAAALERLGEKGVPLPARTREELPMLEKRLNAFLPLFLRFVRFVIFVSVLLYALHVMGLEALASWLRRAFGVDVVSTMASVAVIVLVAFGAWLVLTSWIDMRLTPARGRVVTSRERTLLSLFRNAATIAIVAVTLMFALSELGIDIAPLIASAGVIGLAIGFGAQKMVQDIITGVFIQFENAINVGDVVTVGGTTGAVEKLTIRSVSLRDLEGVFHIIPFSSVDAVSNYMRGFAYHVADLGIAYREDTDQGKAAMLECYEELRADPDYRFKVVGDLEWFGVQSLGDSAVVLRARIKCTPGNQWAVGRRYNELLKKACDRRGIEIPFPHMTVWFGVGKDGEAPAANLRVRGGRTIDGEAGPAATGDAMPEALPDGDGTAGDEREDGGREDGGRPG